MFLYELFFSSSSNQRPRAILFISKIYLGADGSTATKDAILDERDTIWVDIRHKHMKDSANLNNMKKMLATLPQFQDMKDKNCATGYTPDGQHPKTLVEDMVPLLDSSFVRISLPENDAINNLLLLGVKLIKALLIKLKKNIDNNPTDPDRYEISRYVPKLKIVLE
ncbi:45331_t:CDS:2, partial [Gigaspora margarita]